MERLSITEMNGKSIAYTENLNVTFTMPNSNVAVSAKLAKQSGTSSLNVADDAYYCDAVLWAVENGVTSGTSATTFSPNTTCTRAQAVTFLWRSMGSPVPTAASCPFMDVSKDAY